MKRLLAGLTALWLCASLLCGAAAEAVLTPRLSLWKDPLSVQVEVGVQADVHMPLDEERCAQLSALLKHVTLRLALTRLEDEAWSRAALCVDGNETVSIAQRQQNGQTELRLSCLPGEAFTTARAADASSALGMLLGETGGSGSLFGLDGSESEWIGDGYALLCQLADPLSAWGRESSVKTSVKSMGTARLKRSYTVPGDQAESFAAALIAACPLGKLGTLLAGLTFTGQQKLTVLYTSEGAPLQLSYTGRCGPDAEHQREVRLTWRMRRDDTLRDELTLKTPAVSGTDRNTLTLSRKLAAGKNGAMVYDGKFTYEWVASKQKTTLSGEYSLTCREEAEGSALSGTVKLKRQLPGEDSTETVKLTPSLLLTDVPDISGTVLVEQYSGSHVVEQATLSVRITLGEPLGWALQEHAASLDSMNEAELEALRHRAANALGSAVLPALVILPQEDTLYLSADLPPEAWQTIVNAARQALREEETP